MLSIITVVNKYDVFKKGLKKSLVEQTFRDYELIVIENDKGQFASMVDALEFGISQSKGSWNLFVHPDIDFMDKRTLTEFYYSAVKAKAEDPSIVIFGVTGVTHGKLSQPAGNIISGKLSREDYPKTQVYIINEGV